VGWRLAEIWKIATDFLTKKDKARGGDSNSVGRVSRKGWSEKGKEGLRYQKSMRKKKTRALPTLRKRKEVKRQTELKRQQYPREM